MLQGAPAASGGDEATAAPAAAATNAGGVLANLSWLDRLLPVLVVAAMVAGVLIGYYAPQVC